MSQHDLKLWPTAFGAVVAGAKPFEVRLNDRDYDVGDQLNLWEWDPKKSLPTGRMTVVIVTSILQGRFGLPENVCVMGFDPSRARAMAGFNASMARGVFGVAEVAER